MNCREEEVNLKLTEVAELRLQLDQAKPTLDTEGLLQQLHNEKERCDAYLDDVKRLEQQLAACKVKDETPDALYASFEALIIQPDDQALKGWLGEPVAIVSEAFNLEWSSPNFGCNLPVGTKLYSPKGMNDPDYWFDLGYASAKKTIESLCQQLSDLKKELRSIGEATNGPRTDLTATMSELTIELKQQLAEALAACEMKDEFIRLIRDHIPNSVFGKMVIQEALIIQPNDTALKAWLGEPVACRSDGRCQYAIDHDAEGMGHCPPGECCMPLYSPKGMMK